MPSPYATSDDYDGPEQEGRGPFPSDLVIPDVRDRNADGSPKETTEEPPEEDPEA